MQLAADLHNQPIKLIELIKQVFILEPLNQAISHLMIQQNA
jgi:hypothetical protein